MSEKRKRRGSKTQPKPISRPSILDTVPRPDEWTKISSTNEKVEEMKRQEDETKAKAKSLLDSQRRSVEVLTYVKESLQKSFGNSSSNEHKGDNYYVVDNLLGSELNQEMLQETKDMYQSDKLTLDSDSGLCSGQFTAAIVGGADQYSNCPRCVEFLVSLTKHLPSLLTDTEAQGNANEVLSLEMKINDSASIGSMRCFDQKSRIKTLQLLFQGSDGAQEIDKFKTDDLPTHKFRCIVDKNDNTETDERILSVFYYLNPEGWTNECGGGIIVQKNDGDEVLIEAKHDRLVLLRSDLCVHKMQPWLGNDDLMFGGAIVIHLVRK
jgi:hypothetical protein